MRVGILGGGLAGLTIAANLKHPFEVLEQNRECGGLCRSFSEEGFTFDIGGHIFFSRNTKILGDMVSLLGPNRVKGRRNNKISFKGKFVKYPFENGLDELPKEDTFECLYHYIRNQYPEKPANFEEWIYHTFGRGIAEKYMIPYNRKIWNTDLRKMSLHWVEGRVPKPPVEDVIRSAIGIKTEGYKEQVNFDYPRRGGISAIIRSLENAANGTITRDFCVSQVRREGSSWAVSDGRDTRRFDRIISAMPLNDLMHCLDGVPKKIISCADALRYNSLILVMIGLRSEPKDYTAIYFPEKELLYNRVCFMDTFSSENSPPGHSGVIAEITYNEGDRTSGLSDEEVISHTISTLERQGVISKKRVVCSKALRFKYAYVVYDLDYPDKIRMLKSYAADRGIELCGRFGEFEYLNMDACFERAKNMAGKINSIS
ncbi:MAG: FAD-dependent oxidoreductase [archaeon]